MKGKRFAAAALVAGLLASMAPAPPAHADGAASTRNILIGGAAATLIILNHNRKVHERYAEYERQNAATAAQRDDAWAAYRSEKAAYEHEVSVANSLRQEVAIQRREIAQIHRQMSQVQTRSNGFVSQTTEWKTPTQQVAVVSYGWGTL